MASRKKFERHMDSPCCTILYNERSFTVVLQPESVLCAMFGELYETKDQNLFRYFGVSEMRLDENTRISAVVALLPLWVHRNCIEVGRRMYQLTDCFSRARRSRIHSSCRRRESVGEEATARNAFTRPLDEGWAIERDETVRLAFSGEQVAEMRALLPDDALKTMGLW
jgi:hypothetical protein